MYKCFMILSFAMLYNIGQSQVHGGFQQYYYTGDGASSIVPKIYYQSRKNWYGELRYNYEESQTVSLNAGKMFSNKNLFSYSITPVAGIVLGKLNGITIGTNVEIDYKKLFFSSEFQYTFSIDERAENLFFNWSEYGYQITKPIYAGIALQVTHHYSLKNIWEPGIMIGWIYKSWSFPVYVFNPFWGNRNFVAGINWEWTHGDTKKK
jgi:hypothetical protein